MTRNKQVERTGFTLLAEMPGQFEPDQCAHTVTIEGERCVEVWQKDYPEFFN